MSNVDDNDKEGVVLPTMATNATQRVIFGVCEAIQGIHSTRLDKVNQKKTKKKKYLDVFTKSLFFTFL
jgi:uncharacterized protein YifN (PemK superfamily)